MGTAGVAFVAITVMLSTFGSLNSTMLANPRVFFAMAEDGLFFKSMAAVHPKFKTPVNAIVLAALLGVGFVLLRRFEDLADAFVTAILPFYVLGVAAIFVLRRGRDTRRRFVARVSARSDPVHSRTLYLLVNAVVDPGTRWATIAVFVVILVGIPVYYATVGRRIAPPDARSESGGRDGVNIRVVVAALCVTLTPLVAARRAGGYDRRGERAGARRHWCCRSTGASISVVNTATGATSRAAAARDGRYLVQGLEVGGPYSVTARHPGLRLADARRPDAHAEPEPDARFPAAAADDHPRVRSSVTTETDPIMSADRTGAATVISDSALRRLPSLNRTFTDFVILSPEVSDAGPGRVGCRREQSVQQHPDRRRERERSLRARRNRTARRSGARQVDRPRVGARVSGAARAVRRATGQLRRPARECRHARWHERVPRHGVLHDAERRARPQRRLRTRPGVPPDAVRLLDRRADRSRSRALLRRAGVPAPIRAGDRARTSGQTLAGVSRGSGGHRPVRIAARRLRHRRGVGGAGKQRKSAAKHLRARGHRAEREQSARDAPQLRPGGGRRARARRSR